MKKEQKNEKDKFHRYESDMTRKEKRELEKQKLGSMNWKEKLEYIWTYYKAAMAAVIGVIVVIVIVCQLVENSKYKTILNVSVINASMSEDSEAIGEELQNQFGTDNKYDKVSFDTSLMMGDVETADYNMVMKFTITIRNRTCSWTFPHFSLRKNARNMVSLRVWTGWISRIQLGWRIISGCNMNRFT